MVRESPPRGSSRFVPSRTTPTASRTRPLWTPPPVQVFTPETEEQTIKRQAEELEGHIKREEEGIQRMQQAQNKAEGEKAKILKERIRAARIRQNILRKYKGEYVAVEDVLRYAADVGREEFESSYYQKPRGGWPTEPIDKPIPLLVEGWEQIGPDKYKTTTPTSIRVVTGEEAAFKAGAITYAWELIGKDKYRQRRPKGDGKIITRVISDVSEKDLPYRMGRSKERSKEIVMGGILSGKVGESFFSKATTPQTEELFKGTFYKVGPKMSIINEKKKKKLIEDLGAMGFSMKGTWRKKKNNIFNQINIDFQIPKNKKNKKQKGGIKW